ncbi:MAG: zinc-binding dehydrogenase [Candidatus Dormibacteria bacterium]
MSSGSMLAAYASSVGGEHPLDNLEVGERELPIPRPGWARVRTRAAALNHHDLWVLAGVSAPPALPRTLGCDLAGVVDAAAGSGVLGVEPGTAVVAHAVVTCGHCWACREGRQLACLEFNLLSDGPYEGTQAEYCLVPLENLFQLPDGLSFEQAACLPTAYLTAYRMLFSRAELRPGGTVLIQGAGGGLSTAAEALALAAGLRVVVTSRDAGKRQAALQRGVHHALESDRGVAQAVLEITQGRGADAVLESVGEATWASSLRAVRREGTVVVAGATTGPNPPADLRRIFWHQLRILGSTMGTRGEFAELLRFVEAVHLEPLIDSTFELAHARDAYRRLEAGEVNGKLVLTARG